MAPGEGKAENVNKLGCKKICFITIDTEILINKKKIASKKVMSTIFLYYRRKLLENIKRILCFEADRAAVDGEL